ncbi:MULTISPECIES: TerD family protein [Streptomyces]|uniref:Resistance protein n=1 Tax=Streptomyces viridochromogenes TaxID=1938 RepID=A0A0L8LCM7_STRVR|nr:MULTISPECIES: TerD family protein [Streptomyces]KOG35864.1 resistance protein [Streptomyces viridochromogenes]
MLRGLIKGDNTFVPTAALRVAVRSGVDVAALLVTERGRVRGDSDIVFDGAPAHPSGAVRLTGAEDGTVWLDADLTGAEEAVTRVLLVVSTEEGALRDAHGLSVEVFGPDGATVVAYEVTDAGDETAMVLAELYRRSGGWKFRAVGQGYVDGLTGLAVDHGVDVSEEPRETPARAPVAEPAQAPAQIRRPTRDELLDMTPDQIRALREELTRAQTSATEATQDPARAQAPLTASPPPVPRPDPSVWTYGPVFEQRTVTGRHSDVITVKDLPPGPVMVEVTLEGDGHQAMWPLDASNTKGRYLINHGEKGFRGRMLTTVPANGTLRLQLQASDSWQVRVLPLAEARRLTEDTLECEGPELLLHTGGIADATFRYRGKSNFVVFLYRLAGHTDSTTLPKHGTAAINEIGARRDTVPLPEGPVLVQVSMAEGPWSVRLKDVQPHGSGRDGDSPVKLPAPGLPEPRRALGWLRRARH